MNKVLSIVIFLVTPCIYAADKPQSEAEKIATELMKRPVDAHCLFRKQVVTVQGTVSVNNNTVDIDSQWPQENYDLPPLPCDKKKVLEDYLRTIVKKHSGPYEQSPIIITEHDNTYQCTMEHNPSGHHAYFFLDIHFEGQGKSARDTDDDDDYDDDDLISFDHEKCPCCPVS